MKKVFIMSCEDDGGFDLWFDESNKLLGGYFWNDAEWRDEYFNDIFKELGIEIKKMKYNSKLAKKIKKELWGF